MSVFHVKNNLSLLIGKNIDSAATQITDPSGAGYIADGEILVIEEDGTLMTAASTITTAPRFKLVQRSGSRLIYTPTITGANIITYKGTDGTVAVEQVTNIGYNGVSGSIDVSGTEDYILNLTFNFNEAIYSQQLNNYPFIVDARSGAITQIEVAESLQKQINAQMTNNSQRSVTGEGPLVVATMLSAEAGTAIGAAADTVVGYKGSKTITVTDVGANATVIAIASGDYFRAGTAVTSPVYKIVTSTVGTGGGVLTLATPLTADVNLLGTTSEFFTKAAGDAAAAGVVLTGQSLLWQLDWFKYMQVTFKVGLKEFGATTFATTAPVRPTGSGFQIAEYESFCEGFRGKLNRNILPFPATKQDADTSATYDVIFIAFFDDSDMTPVDGVKAARQEIMLAFVDGALQATDVLAVLNPYMLTTPRRLANVTL